MKTYNITAQAYSLFDEYKQTVLLNEVVNAKTKDEATNYFYELLGIDHQVLKIYSIEEIPQGAA